MERIEFRTDEIVSQNYTTQTRATRMTPRRSFEYSYLADSTLRQRMSNATYARGGGVWYLPLWVDAVELSAPAAATSDMIAVQNAGFFAAGDPAFIQSPDRAIYELVQVIGITAGTMQLSGALANAYPMGSRIHPVRRARIDDQYNASQFTSSANQGRIKFNIVEPNPSPAYVWPVVYRGFPVLEHRPDTGRDPDTTFTWMTSGFDDGVSIPRFRDAVGVPLYRQVHDWKLATRAEIDRFRAMIYALEGKQKSIWVPTWAEDMTLYASLSAGANGMKINRCGAAQVLNKVNRKDVRIETTAGTYYRRITNVIDNGTHETVTFDSVLPIALTRANIIQISYIALCRSESDIFELNYFTGQAAEVATSWRSRQNDI